MKLTLSPSALVAILGFALASVPVTVQAQAPDTTATAPAPVPAATTSTKAKKSKPTEYMGNVTAIDTTANTVTVATTAQVLALAITPKTIIQKDKKKATLADFSIGDSVTGSYVKDATAGALTAHSLRKKTTTISKPAATAANAAASQIAPVAPVPPAPGQ
jgi:hypothetical protein